MQSADAPTPRLTTSAQAELRAAAAKTAGVLWEPQIRYAAATTNPENGIASHPRAMARLRGHAHAIASATADPASERRNHVTARDGPAGSRPARPGRPGRPASTPDLIATLAGRLTARDRWLLRMLHEHRVLTSAQITQLAFGTTRGATARLLILHRYRAVDRFRPLARRGSAPWHFVLGEAGAWVLAAEDGVSLTQLGYRRDRTLDIAVSPQLAHAIGTNGCFTALAASARAGHGRLACW